MIPGNYPTPSNVKLYVGDVYLDDAYRVDWQCQNPKTPLYSWADSKYRAVAQGREIVSGRLIINYRFPGYLKAALDGRTGGSVDPDMENYVNEVVEKMAYSDVDGRIDALMQAHGSPPYGDIGTMKAALEAINSPRPRPSNKMEKGIYQAGQQAPFDIKIIYGDVEGYHLSKTLRDCHITGESQTISGAATGGGDMSSSGSPIYEVYSFFCRSVDEGFSNPS